MKKYIKLNKEKINLVVSNYNGNNRLAILADTKEEPYCDVTINLPDIELSKNTVAIDDMCKSCGLEQELINAGVIKRIVDTIKYNYGMYDIAEIDMEKLKEYDLYGLKEYQEIEDIKEFYKTYNKEEMINIGKNIGFVFVETSNGDNFIISKNDIADFIFKEADRCGHKVDMAIYVPNNNIDEPILTTYGCYLNKINPLLRKDIVDRIVELQMADAKPRDVKIFDNEIFSKIDIKEFGEEAGKTIQFDKFFKQYYPEMNSEYETSEEEEEF